MKYSYHENKKQLREELEDIQTRLINTLGDIAYELYDLANEFPETPKWEMLRNTLESLGDEVSNSEVNLLVAVDDYPVRKRKAVTLTK